MNESLSLDKLPDPPENLKGPALEQWYNIGENLVASNSLTNETLDKLADLCFWELQKNEVMEQLKESKSVPSLEVDTGASGNANTSVYLSNLKAIQAEIDKIRGAFGLSPSKAHQISETPFIPDVVYQHLPESLKKCCDLIDGQRNKDLFLTSALPVLASHLTNILTEHADGSLSPDLYTFIVEDSGASKKMAQKAIELCSVLNHNIIKNNKPDRKSLLLNTDSGISEFYQALFESDGKGLLFDTELEKLIDAEQKSWNWRSFTGIVRKAFNHQPLNVKLKSGNVFIQNPRLSIFFSANLNQFKKIFERSGKDHFALYALYTYDAPVTWQSPRPDNNSRKLQQKITKASEQSYFLYKELSMRNTPLYIEFLDEHWQMIDETFAEKMQIIEELDLPKTLHKSNNNAAILALKLATLFTVLREFETNSSDLSTIPAITPSEPDMIAALWLADTYIKHAIRLFEILPATSAQDARGERFNRFYRILPAEFETSDAVEMADKIEIPARTAKRYLNELLESKKLVRVRRGVYKKRV